MAFVKLCYCHESESNIKYYLYSLQRIHNRLVQARTCRGAQGAMPPNEKFYMVLPPTELITLRFKKQNKGFSLQSDCAGRFCPSRTFIPVTHLGCLLT